MGVRQRATGGPDLEAETDSAARCWCGAENLEPLSADYARCGGCGTVVYRLAVDAAEYTSSGDAGFYGDGYWRHHVPRVLGLPGLEQRARADLAERAVFHLVKILDHLAPGGRVLELGCGAGSLTYLLRQAGFDAEGLELGPAAIEVARGRFGLEVHRGPLESMDDPGPWDAIVAVDVLEHLPDPLATMTLCARRLAGGGRLFLQTPCYRQQGAEWRMLLPKEHLQLFTEASVERLLRAAGFGAVEIGLSLFPHDMWLAAALEEPLVERPDPLADVPPLVVALIDAYAEGTRASSEREAVDADRRRKQEDIVRLQRELATVRSDQAAKAALIDRLTSELASAREDQAAKEELIAGVSSELASAREDQAAKEELIGRVSSELESVRADRSAKNRVIARVGAELETARTDQAAKAELIEKVSTELATVRGDQAAKAALIDRLGSELETVREDQQAKEIVIRQLDCDLREAAAELKKIHADRRYRLLQAIGVRLGGRR